MPKIKIEIKQYQLYLIIGGILSATIILALLMSVLYMPHDPQTTDNTAKLIAPSSTHWFGGDHLGRDVFSRAVQGAQMTILASVFGIAIALFLGAIMGSIAGYFGGFLDSVVMLLSDSIMAFPGILLALVFVAVFGPGIFNIILALGIVFAPSYARIFRTGIRQLRSRDYIVQASLLGVKTPRLILIHIFPNLLPQLSPAIVVGMANMALAEAGMSYLGLGIQPPFASWGKMLRDAQSYIFQAPWTILFPSLFLIVYVLGLYFLSEGLTMRYGSRGNIK